MRSSTFRFQALLSCRINRNLKIDLKLNFNDFFPPQITVHRVSMESAFLRAWKAAHVQVDEEAPVTINLATITSSLPTVALNSLTFLRKVQFIDQNNKTTQ